MAKENASYERARTRVGDLTIDLNVAGVFPEVGEDIMEMDFKGLATQLVESFNGSVKYFKQAYEDMSDLSSRTSVCLCDEISRRYFQGIQPHQQVVLEKCLKKLQKELVFAYVDKAEGKNDVQEKTEEVTGEVSEIVRDLNDVAGGD